MADRPPKVLICSCEDTMPLDVPAVQRGCRGAEVSTARQLCRAELDKFCSAAAGGEQLVNATTAGTQAYGAQAGYLDPVSVAADANGNYVVAWETLVPGVSDQFFARVFNCDIERFVPTLREDRWTWHDSIRYAKGCDTIHGTSGSPIVSVATGEVVGINNTGNDDGQVCTLNNPCEVNPDGTTTTVVGPLNQPTSVKFIGNTAYVVCYTGEIWKIENLLPPRGPGR